MHPQSKWESIKQSWCPSVCLSVCLSACQCSCSKTVRFRAMVTVVQ